MNKILSLSLLCGAALALGSCAGEEKSLFDKSAAERLNAISETYSSRLMASPNGWAMQLYPQNVKEYPEGAGYLLLMRFNADHTVKVAMNNVLSDSRYAESTSVWDIITDQGPVLSFSTYNNCLHAFTNPEDLTFTGTSDDPDNEKGTGMGGDYEFVIVKAPEDGSYLMLKGKKRGTYNLLTAMQDSVDYQSYLSDIISFQNKMFASNAPTFDVLHMGDSLYKMADANKGIPNIYPYDGDAIINESFNPFLITKRGDDYYLRFRDSIKYAGQKAQDFRYDKTTDRFQSVENSDCYIVGDSPLRFFTENMSGNTAKWKFDTNNMSDDFKAIYDAAASGLKERKLTLNWLQLAPATTDSMNVVMQYTGKTASTIRFAFKQAYDSEGATYTYTQPIGTAGTVLTVVPQVETLIKTLSQKFTVRSNETDFNLRALKLTSVSSPNTWFVITLQ